MLDDAAQPPLPVALNKVSSLPLAWAVHADPVTGDVSWIFNRNVAQMDRVCLACESGLFLGYVQRWTPDWISLRTSQGLHQPWMSLPACTQGWAAAHSEMVEQLEPTRGVWHFQPRLTAKEEQVRVCGNSWSMVPVFCCSVVVFCQVGATAEGKVEADQRKVLKDIKKTSRLAEKTQRSLGLDDEAVVSLRQAMAGKDCETRDLVANLYAPRTSLHAFCKLFGCSSGLWSRAQPSKATSDKAAPEASPAKRPPVSPSASQYSLGTVADNVLEEHVRGIQTKQHSGCSHRRPTLHFAEGGRGRTHYYKEYAKECDDKGIMTAHYSTFCARIKKVHGVLAPPLRVFDVCDMCERLRVLRNWAHRVGQEDVVLECERMLAAENEDATARAQEWRILADLALRSYEAPTKSTPDTWCGHDVKHVVEEDMSHVWPMPLLNARQASITYREAVLAVHCHTHACRTTGRTMVTLWDERRGSKCSSAYITSRCAPCLHRFE